MIDLDDLCQRSKIFIDSSSLMLSGAEALFLQGIAPKLKEYGSKIILPIFIIENLQNKQKKDNNKDNDNNKVMEGLRLVKMLHDRGLLDLREDIDGSNTDGQFTNIFRKFGTQYDLCLITQSKDLANKIINNINSESGKCHNILYIDSTKGHLCDWKPILNREKGQDKSHTRDLSNNRNTFQNNLQETQEKVFPFRIFEKITDEPEIPLPRTKLLGRGDYVVSKKLEKYFLSEEIAEGGEGVIFQTNISNIVCKVYKNESLTSHKAKKLSLIVDKNIEITGVCLPKDIVVNKEGMFVGYLMEKAEGYALQKSVFVKPLLQKKFPGWTRKSLVELAITVIERISALHRMNIIIGDINPLNILVKDATTVFFVDSDSFQVENFCCPVGTVEFTAPEIQGRRFSLFLRSNENLLP